MYLQRHNSPGDGVVALEHSRVLHPLPVVDQHADETEDKAEHPWTQTRKQALRIIRAKQQTNSKLQRIIY